MIQLRKRHETWKPAEFTSRGITDAQQFAIRPNIRNNEQLNRDVVIKTVADAVTRLSSGHSVDLSNYDCLILVEVYRVRYIAGQDPRLPAALR